MNVSYKLLSYFLLRTAARENLRVIYSFIGIDYDDFDLFGELSRNSLITCLPNPYLLFGINLNYAQ